MGKVRSVEFSLYPVSTAPWINGERVQPPITIVALPMPVVDLWMTGSLREMRVYRVFVMPRFVGDHSGA